MNSFFVESIDLKIHPIKKSKRKIRIEYFTALSYIVNKVASRSEGGLYPAKRLEIYKEELFLDVEDDSLVQKAESNTVSSCISKPWRRKLRYMLICDLFLILLDEELIEPGISIVKSYLTSRSRADIDSLLTELSCDVDIDKSHLVVADLIAQYRINKAFLTQAERRIIVTANMSAGKSTLINAFIGRRLTRTSQEVCTGNICYLFSKPFEDGNAHLLTKKLTLRALPEELRDYDWAEPVCMASYFTSTVSRAQRLCIIDTPGADAALYQNHKDIAYTALRNEKYDLLLYILSPTKLGTDAEIKHLKWIYQNVDHDKIVFVLNKLDEYKVSDNDSIEESIQGLKADLLKLGFETPIICPVSAYFSYLLKLKMVGQRLSDDEWDDYVLLSKRFKKPAYDLSRYYDGVRLAEYESDEMKLSKYAGIYGIEKIIYGG